MFFGGRLRIGAYEIGAILNAQLFVAQKREVLDDLKQQECGEADRKGYQRLAQTSANLQALLDHRAPSLRKPSSQINDGIN